MTPTTLFRIVIIDPREKLFAGLCGASSSGETDRDPFLVRKLSGKNRHFLRANSLEGRSTRRRGKKGNLELCAETGCLYDASRRRVKSVAYNGGGRTDQKKRSWWWRLAHPARTVKRSWEVARADRRQDPDCPDLLQFVHFSRGLWKAAGHRDIDFEGWKATHPNRPDRRREARNLRRKDRRDLPNRRTKRQETPKR